MDKSQNDNLPMGQDLHGLSYFLVGLFLKPFLFNVIFDESGGLLIRCPEKLVDAALDAANGEEVHPGFVAVGERGAKELGPGIGEKLLCLGVGELEANLPSANVKPDEAAELIVNRSVRRLKLCNGRKSLGELHRRYYTSACQI